MESQITNQVREVIGALHSLDTSYNSAYYQQREPVTYIESDTIVFQGKPAPNGLPCIFILLKIPDQFSMKPKTS